MLPNCLALPMLVLNVAVFVYLNRERAVLYVAGFRMKRQIQTFRAAGLLVLLFAASLAHAQYEVFEDQARCPGCIGVSGANGTPHEVGKLASEIARRYEEAKRHIMLDIPQHTTPNQWMWSSESCSKKAQQHMDCINTAIYLGNNKYGVTWYDAMTFSFERKSGVIASMPRSDSDWLIAQQMYAEKGIKYDGVDWTNFMDFPNLARYGMWIWEHLGRLLILSILLFFLVQFGGGARESNDTDIEDMLDPEYRTGFVANYHGDDAFEVPDGMESAHRSIPVRKVRA